MSETNGNNEGNALPAEPRAVSNLSSTELEIQHNKAASAVEYHEREIQAAETGVTNLEAKIERLKEQVAEAESQLDEARARVEEAESAKTEAELHLAGFEGEGN